MNHDPGEAPEHAGIRDPDSDTPGRIAQESAGNAGEWRLTTIGVVRSPFPEKFGVPRQAGLHRLFSVIEMAPELSHPDCTRGLDGFSHLWVSFIFHHTAAQGWRPLVRPPRLGGNRKVGVLASRSPFRPNPLGLSAVRLERIWRQDGRTALLVRGGDFIDGTPVVDIKPYLAYADAIPTAESGYASAPPEAVLDVRFSDAAAASLDHLAIGLPAACLTASGATNLRDLIRDTLALDPRPAYARNDRKTYFLRLFDVEIVWHGEDFGILVTEVRSPGGYSPADNGSPCLA